MKRIDRRTVYAVLSFLGFAGIFVGTGMGDSGAPLGQCAMVAFGSLAVWAIFAKLAARPPRLRGREVAAAIRRIAAISEK